MSRIYFIVQMLFVLICSYRLYAVDTEVQYLSGQGPDDAVEWDFYCTGGMNSGSWTKIPVPSCWELEGFGNYDYGRVKTKSNEKGRYKYSFDMPASWKDKKVLIYFDGSMTDTEVKINGQSAGATHQGAFYSFSYDITNKLNFTGSNLLEITVSKQSSNASVNSAERMADYWVFGGIFRPVYLKAFPREYIQRIAVDPKANGNITMDVFLHGLSSNAIVECQVTDLSGSPIGTPLSQFASSGDAKVRIAGAVSGVKSWNAESPNMYSVDVSIKRGGTTIHTHSERIAFRTVKVVKGDGVYINNKKMLFRGVNRHAFRPNTGRTLSRQDMLDDVLLIKQTNFNAVRNSHYPMDREFYDLCDSLGLYLIDELAGWQTAYDTQAGEKLVKEMIQFNQNHPSVIIWSNGNEGGWNTELDDDFHQWDLQKRPLIHTKDLSFNGFNTRHYRSYGGYTNDLKGDDIVMATEFLHGRYDGGHGVGLEDYWKLFRKSPKSAGGFLWVFADEGVERTDKGGEIDTYGKDAPDGIFGPYHEPEGSYYTIRELFSPVYIAMDRLPASFDGTIKLENRYDFTDLNRCFYAWKLVSFNFYNPDSGYAIDSEGTISAESIAPGNSGDIKISLPPNWKDSDALYLDVTDKNGTNILTRSWMITSQSAMRKRVVSLEEANSVTFTDGASVVTLKAGEFSYKFNKGNGRLTKVLRDGKTFSLANGPILSIGNASLETFNVKQDGRDYKVEATYSGNLKSVTWTVHSSGWLSLQYKYSLNGEYEYYGINFDYPEDKVQGAQWLGEGPSRVWRNRMRGTIANIWQRDHNDAITGQVWDYPEFKGFYSNSYWMRLLTDEGPIHCVMDSSDIFMRLYTPKPGFDAGKDTIKFPDGDISFLHGISARGTTFWSSDKTGPMGEPYLLSDTFNGSIYFYFGDLADSSVSIENIDMSGKTNLKPLSLNFQGKGSFYLYSPVNQNVELKLYSLSGRLVTTLFSGEIKAGLTSVMPAVKLASGVYLYSIMNGKRTLSKKTLAVY